eukprot:CAMPEP_0118801930 /NCGR_PEP_ID=MMETSP1161-20130426/3297_1 /TAXON_ID=249345 /ORGANISM="Picochlorum oklahomensis, Strain CCMP2329" /LENGTH=370 /DNA_ID=CAMNT_0006729911 /DNA_START=159 /DNA_END=1271 /DNA_ORIENTATION=-
MEEFLANVRACAPEYSPLHDMKDEEILNSKRCVRDDQGAGIVSLNLSSLSLMNVPESISSLVSLTSLCLSANGLKSLPESISQLSLHVLLLDNNLFHEIPVSIRSMKSLKHLDLSKNKLGDCDAVSLHLDSLELLDLSGNTKMTRVCSDIFHLLRIKQIDLHSCALIEVPKAIGHATLLERISLHSNELTHVPSEIGQCQNLTWLSLNSNKLESIPSSIGRLTKLSRLSLHINALRTVPDELSQCVHLEALSLHSNCLESLPDSLSNLKECERLSLYHNPTLGCIPDGVCHMTQLKELWLYDCGIHEVNPNIGFVNLQKLWLDRNPITRLPESMKKLTMLQELYLDQTQVEREDVEHITASMHNLKTLAY